MLETVIIGTAVGYWIHIFSFSVYIVDAWLLYQ